MFDYFAQYYFNYLDGAVIDSLDYYSTLYKLNTHIPLLFVCDCSTTQVYNQMSSLIKDRYKFEFPFYVTNKKPINKRLITVGLHSYKCLNSSLNKFFVIGQFDKTNIINKDVCPNNLIDNYEMKIAFPNYKEITHTQHNLYINTLDNLYSPKFLFNIASICGYDTYFVKQRKHQLGLFSMFDTYLYLDDGKYEDVHPRLFHECYFYGKDIVYISGRQNGAYIRYKEIEEGKFNSKVLYSNDIVFDYILGNIK